MERPFYHLDFPYAVLDTWKDQVQDFDAKQIIHDPEARFLSPHTRSSLATIGLEPAGGNAWSWTPMPVGLWHTDQRLGVGPEVAINFLLQGEAGMTEWADASRLQLVDDEGRDPTYGTPDTRYTGRCIPQFGSNLRPGVARLDHIAVPHRVNRARSKETRWTYRLFVRQIGRTELLTWKTALQLFGIYLQ